MSLRRIAARAPVVAAGALASAALMAAPTWAGPPNPHGGNSTNAKSCQGTGWESQGFKSHDECVSYYADKLI
jgi:hypothetical protein